MNEKEYKELLEKKKKEAEKQLDEELKQNPELRKVLDESPEKKAMYIEKIIDSSPLFVDKLTDDDMKKVKINPKRCETCRFSHGAPPFEDSPYKRYCMIYSHAEGEEKPSEVYIEGRDCEYYSKHND